MIYVIVGHRGCGKTSFLQRVAYYYQARNLACECIDLDSEIEKQSQKKIKELFDRGEDYFRALENEIFEQRLLESKATRKPVFIAVGAGFKGPIPKSARVIWLRRPTDSMGRIFLDRPRLDNDLTPLEEFKKRYDEREKRFRKIYDKVITNSEGFDFINPYEPVLLGLKPADLQACLTILPEHCQTTRRIDGLLSDGLLAGVKYFELRDDLLSEGQIRNISAKLPTNKVLISLRKPQASVEWLDYVQGYCTDWAAELGAPPENFRTRVVSLHTHGVDEVIEEAGERLLNFKAEHYKFSLEIKNFTELWSGHRFFQQDPVGRSFLPRSKDGRWHWYRLIQNRRMHLNFMRVDDGSSFDQPLQFDYLRYPTSANHFAAVLGDPVTHSQTPGEQNDYFTSHNMGVTSIRMTDSECQALSLSILERLGLRAAAVTSPLKMKMRELCVSVDKKADELGAVNTIVAFKGGWHGTNTDIQGLQMVFKTFDMPEDVVVWGGGGTRMALKQLLPRAHFFSARLGEEIWVEKRNEAVSPEVVVWALGRSLADKTKLPPENWRPEYVIDLNYSEDSPGLEYAQRIGARYISGKAFFKGQARQQRQFWSEAKL